MRLINLFISGFRNIEQLRLTPGNSFNLIYGRNGQGKTNLLEALYLLGSPRSFRSARLPDFIGYGKQTAQIRGEVESTGMRTNILLTLENAGRRVELDGKAIHKASDLYGKLSTVIFSPEDAAMVRSGPESRRRYLDRAAYACDAGYLPSWNGYHRVLKQRNQLLKNSDKSGLDIWTEQLAETGAEIIIRRQRFTAQLNKRLQRHYGSISGDAETVGIRYAPEGIRATDRQPVRDELLDLFDRHQQSDIRYGTTTAGPHRDDLTFQLDGRPLKSFGSTGQQKSFILALKMAELDIIREVYGEQPLLLLDDICSELDGERNRNFMNFLNVMGIQVFMTTTEHSLRAPETTANYAVFRMESGNLTFEGKETHE